MGLLNRFIGKKGEDTATLFLKKKHYKILERNYRCRTGEIDIIAKDGSYVVFVEVKERKDDKLGMPSEYVTPSKQRKIISAARNYMTENEIVDLYCRFDVVEICGDEINHMENAFQAKRMT